MIFIGHTKFSIYSPISGAWKATNGTRFKSQKSYKDYLFSDSRLASRVDIFINYSLPQLELAARNYDVTHLVSYSEYLPDKYESVLLQAQNNFPFIELEKQEMGKAGKDIEEIATAKLSQTSDPLQPFGMYRLDDDDILPVDYFDQVAPYISPEFIGMQITLGTGVSAIYNDQKFFNARKTYHPMLNIGYTSVHRFDDHGNMNRLPVAGHNVADRSYPVILDSRKLGYLWTRHTEQDTTLGLVETDEMSLLESLKRHMNRHPALHDLDELHQSFPVLQGKITNAGSPELKRQDVVVEPMQLHADGIRIKPLPIGGQISFNTEMTCDMSSEARNALISFIFVDSKGLRVAPESLDLHFEKQAITRSGNPKVGWFRYLSTKPGKNRTLTQFDLPDDVFVGVITLMKWRRKETQIVLRSLSVESTK